MSALVAPLQGVDLALPMGLCLWGSAYGALPQTSYGIHLLDLNMAKDMRNLLDEPGQATTCPYKYNKQKPYVNHGGFSRLTQKRLVFGRDQRLRRGSLLQKRSRSLRFLAGSCRETS
jgi:hypothetical protein